MPRVDLYIRNGEIVTEDAVFRGGVLVEDGQIVEVVEGSPERSAFEVIYADDLLVLPGLVDGHVHFSEPGRGHWEGFRTGSHAAAAGGVTTVVEMPLNASPPTVDAAALRLKREAACASIVDYALWGGLVADNRRDLAGLAAGGVVGFKAFMCASATDFPRVDDIVMRDGLLQIAQLGSFLAVHAEDEVITTVLTERLRQAGRTDRAAWGASRPIIAELAAIDAAIAMTAETKARLHIVHVSCAEGVDRVTNAKQRGIDVTAETCPHYLFFTEDYLERLGPVAKCAPPLRTAAHREALWDRLLAGEIDFVASDHSPCLWEEKAAGDEDIFLAWGGISGLQSTLPAMLTAGVHERGLSLPDLARLCAGNPARRFGFYPHKGAIMAGADADLVLVDPGAEYVLAAAQLHYRNAHSAYVGSQFRGSVMRTIRRGETIFRDGQITAMEASGIFLDGRNGSEHVETAQAS